MSLALTQTTLSAPLLANQSVMTVAAATGISNPVNGYLQKLYIIDPDGQRGELVAVTAVVGTQVSISRLDEFRSGHYTGAIIIIAPLDQTVESFHEYDPVGRPSTLNGSAVQVTPFINIVTGRQWLQGLVGASGSFCWVPGWNNGLVPPGPTAAVASAAGVVLPTGPLFHITGALAITGFTLPVGFTGGSFTVIPDGVFTWTAAGNIALAGTAVVSKALTFTWDANAAKWYPSYIA